MYSKRRIKDPILKDGPEWKYVLSRDEKTKIDISRRLLEALKYYRRYMGIRTLTEAAARAIALGIRDDMKYQDPRVEAVKMIEKVIKEHLRQKGIKGIRTNKTFE